MLCYISLGSNAGDREGNLRRSLELFKEFPGLTLKRISSVYETQPWGPVKDQPDFLNMAAEVFWDKSARELLKVGQEIEKSLGRKTAQKWGPRNIDVDILYCGQTVLRDKDFVLPHPRIRERFFVLRPMADLAPQWKDPATHKTVAQMLEDLTDPGRWRKINVNIANDPGSR